MTSGPILVGRSGGKEILADISRSGSAVKVALLRDYEMLLPAGLAMPCRPGAPRVPGLFRAGTVIELHANEADALIAAGAAARNKSSEQSPPVFILVGADKGGVGKTTVSRAAADYLSGLKSRLIDTQAPKGDFRLFYPEADILDLTATTGQMAIFDAPVPLTIMDVAAGSLAPTLSMLDRVGVLEDVRAGSVRLALLYLLGPSVASLSEVVEANRTISGKLDLFFVKNHINATEYWGWEKDPRFGEALIAMKPRMIDVPQLDEVAAEAVQQRGQPFSTFAADATNSRILRGYVADWLSRVRAEFERVGLGTLAHPATAVHDNG